MITFLTVGDGAGPRSVHAFGHVGSDQLETVFALVQSLRSVLDPRRYHHAVPRSFRQRFAARYQRSQFIFICTCHTFINYFFHSFILSFFLSFFLSFYLSWVVLWSGSATGGVGWVKGATASVPRIGRAETGLGRIRSVMYRASVGN